MNGRTRSRPRAERRRADARRVLRVDQAGAHGAPRGAAAVRGAQRREGPRRAVAGGRTAPGRSRATSTTPVLEFDPFAARSTPDCGSDVETDRVSLWHHDTGGDGEPVLLLGGFTAGHFAFDFVRPELAGHRLITWEPRGLGRSACPPGPYSVAAWRTTSARSWMRSASSARTSGRSASAATSRTASPRCTPSASARSSRTPTCGRATRRSAIPRSGRCTQRSAQLRHDGVRRPRAGQRVRRLRRALVRALGGPQHRGGPAPGDGGPGGRALPHGGRRP